jgi:hypothetical protein
MTHDLSQPEVSCACVCVRMLGDFATHRPLDTGERNKMKIYMVSSCYSKRLLCTLS